MRAKTTNPDKVPLLELKFTTPQQKASSENSITRDNPDTFRLYIRGKMQDIPYTVTAKPTLYRSENCHKANVYKQISDMPCNAFPDSFQISFSFYDNEYMNGFICSLWLRRKKNIFTVQLDVSIYDDVKDSMIWQPNKYIKELKKNLEKAGCNILTVYEEEDIISAMICFSIDFPVSNYVDDKVNASIDKLMKATKKTHQNLIKKAKKNSVGFKI